MTVLPCMCITQETFINIVMSWYDHYCADANIFILSYLPCWSCIFFTIAFIMWKSFVCKFVLLMLNKFILVHKWFKWMVVICHVFYCILCCIWIFYHVLCQKWQNKAVKSIIYIYIYIYVVMNRVYHDNNLVYNDRYFIVCWRLHFLVVWRWWRYNWKTLAACISGRLWSGTTDQQSILVTKGLEYVALFSFVISLQKLLNQQSIWHYF